MSRIVKEVTYTTCDRCGHIEEGHAPRDWFSWVVDQEPGNGYKAAETGKLKHNCPRCAYRVGREK